MIGDCQGLEGSNEQAKHKGFVGTVTPFFRNLQEMGPHGKKPGRI